MENETNSLVARWLQCDRVIRAKTAELSALRIQRQDLNRQIIPILLRTYADQNKKTPLKVVERRKYTQLTFGFLKSCLDECIDDAETTEALLQYVRSKRTIERSHDIVCRESPATARVAATTAAADSVAGAATNRATRWV